MEAGILEEEVTEISSCSMGIYALKNGFGSNIKTKFSLAGILLKFSIIRIHI